MDIDQFRVAPGTRTRLADFDPDADGGLTKSEAKRALGELTERLDALQEMLYVDGRHNLLVVLQAIDAGGKDSTIRGVFQGVNPQGVNVVSFKTPTARESAHDFLWRVHQHVPAFGQLTVFNRSHYEDVLIVRVHDLVPEPRWRRRYEHIRNFEQMLIDEGTTLLKFYLHISKDEQRKRQQERIDNPAKRWKFEPADLEERRYWDGYQAAFEDMVNETSTEAAPWYVVPANHNWFRNLVVASAVVETLSAMDLRYPPADPSLDATVVE